MSKDIYIAPTATIVDPEQFEIGDYSTVEAGAIIGENVRIGLQTFVGAGAHIGSNSMFTNNVYIGPRVSIKPQALVLDGAMICPNDVRSRSSDARKLGHGVSIGRRVLLHDEVELGPNAIVPSQRTIRSIGSFGTKNRVVTIYGSDKGPRFSIGCHIGVSYERAEYNITHAVNTVEKSAATYEPSLPEFRLTGNIVQQAYDAERATVKRIKSLREKYGLISKPVSSEPGD